MKKLALILMAVVSMALVSCGGGGGVMTPQTTEISGDLGKYFEVVDNPVKLQGDIWSIQLKMIKQFDSWRVEPYGTSRTDGKKIWHAGFGLETFDKDGNLIAKRAATAGGLSGPYSSQDVLDLVNLQEGETGYIRWSCQDSERGVKGMTFKITSAFDED